MKKITFTLEATDDNQLEIISNIYKLPVTVKTFYVEDVKQDKKIGFQV